MYFPELLTENFFYWISVDQWSLSGGEERDNSLPTLRGFWQWLKDTCGSHYWLLVCKSQDFYRTSYNTQDSLSQQKFIWPQMSILPRLRDSYRVSWLGITTLHFIPSNRHVSIIYQDSYEWPVELTILLSWVQWFPLSTVLLSVVSVPTISEGLKADDPAKHWQKFRSSQGLHHNPHVILLTSSHQENILLLTSEEE